MKLKNRKREINKQAIIFRLFLLYSMFFNHSSVLLAQNLEKIDYYEAIKVLEKTEKNPEIPVIAVIDGAVKRKIFRKEVFWKNKYEIQNNGIDDDGNGYVDDYMGWNFSNNSKDVTNKGVGDWHGTPVCSIVEKIISKSKGVQLMNLVKGESIHQIIESLAYVFMMRKAYNETKGEKGAFVVAVNCSWGKNRLWASDYPEWCEIYNKLGKEGVLVISSVPNDDLDIEKVGDMPSTCNSEYLITVTNTNTKDKKIEEAAYGKYSVDISAPGDKSYTLLNTGKYGFFGGTSAAAPHVTGTIGLMYSIFLEDFYLNIKHKPEEVASLIKKCIVEGSNKIESLNGITAFEGRLNAFNSIKLLFDYYNKSSIYENIFQQLKIVSIYPNPAINNVTVLLESNEDKEVFLDVTDLNGRILNSFPYFVKAGINTIEIFIKKGKMKKGVYILKTRSLSGVVSNDKKIIVR